jgi:hypothetical protein
MLAPAAPANTQVSQVGHDQIGNACAGKAHRHDAGSADPVREITADQPAAAVGQVKGHEQHDGLSQIQAAGQAEPGGQHDHAGPGGTGKHPGEPEAPEFPAFQGVSDRTAVGYKRRIGCRRRRITPRKADQG